MSRYLLKHTAVLVHFESSTEMKDRIDVLDWDKLSTYGQDDLPQLAQLNPFDYSYLYVNPL
jgi:hypothetical protein